jgi:DinB superfamily
VGVGAILERKRTTMDRNAEPATLVRSLAATTARVEAVARHLSAEQLRVSPAPKGWSPNEILWHIRATADVYGEHITRILNEGQPRWSHVSPRARMKKARYDELPFAESSAAFAQQRTELLAVLGSIAPEAWKRVAIVKVRWMEDEWRLTLDERVWGMADHEEGHCTQMEKVAAALSQSA